MSCRPGCAVRARLILVYTNLKVSGGITIAMSGIRNVRLALHRALLEVKKGGQSSLPKIPRIGVIAAPLRQR